jgi:CRP-like cAMP-binding protein
MSSTSAALPQTPPLSLWRRLRARPIPPWYEILGAVGFGLVALQWSMTDLLTLRVVAVSSSLSFVAYNLYITRPPLWLPIWANVVFICINVVQIGRLLAARAELQLEPHEDALWQALFHRVLSQRQMRRLLAAGTLESANEGDALPHGLDEHGRHSLCLVVDGFASVLVSSKPVATLGRADFVGEMSFLDASLPTHAHVVALEPVSYVRWDGDALRSLFESEPPLQHALHAIWTQQLVRRLGRMDERVRLRSSRSANGDGSSTRALIQRRQTVLLPALEQLERDCKDAAALAEQPDYAEHVAAAGQALNELSRTLAELPQPKPKPHGEVAAAAGGVGAASGAPDAASPAGVGASAGGAAFHPDQVVAEAS